MSWWQKKLLRYGLRYGLARTGLLEETALDLDNLDITIGKKNVITLTDIGLKIERISELLQLPPCLEIESARVVSLRLTIPADFYKSSITVDVDGVEFALRLRDEVSKPGDSHGPSSPPSPTTSRRNRHRRAISATPMQSDEYFDNDGHARLPLVHEMARSFLMEEPLQERRELEATLSAQTPEMDDSIISETSDGAEIGTGVGIGVPGFLASFLQGIVDRFTLEIRNVVVRVTVGLQTKESIKRQVAIVLSIGSCKVGDSVPADTQDGTKKARRREVQLHDISVRLEGDGIGSGVTPRLAQLEGAKDSASPTPGALETPMQASSEALHASVFEGHLSPSRSATSIPSPMISRHSLESMVRHETPDVAQSGYLESDPLIASRSLLQQLVTQEDAPMDSNSPSLQHSAIEDDFDIRPGDDNLSWGSRRSQSQSQGHVAEDDLWNSMISQPEIAQSVMLDRPPSPAFRASSQRSSSPDIPRTRRAVSPYDRGLQSPGSWPRPNERSPSREPFNAGPGSWPNPEHATHSVIETPGQILMRPDPDLVDNKLTALDYADVSPPVADLLDKAAHDDDDDVYGDMSQSRVFSHEEAESMYMSAMSTNYPLPGGWGTDAEHEHESNSPVLSHVTPRRSSFRSHASSEDPAQYAPGSPLLFADDRSTPRASSPQSRSSSPAENDQPPPESTLQGSIQVPDLIDIHTGDHSRPETHVIHSSAQKSEAAVPSPVFEKHETEDELRESISLGQDGRASDHLLADEQQISPSQTLLSIDEVIISIPLPDGETCETSQSPKGPTVNPAASSMASPRGLPGTFSAYSQMSNSRFEDFGMKSSYSSSYAKTHERPIRRAPPAVAALQPLDVKLGTVLLDLDMESSKILFQAVSTITATIKPTSQAKSAQPKTGKPENAGSRVSFSVQVDQLRACFRYDHQTLYASGMAGDPSKVLLQLDVGSIELHSLDEVTLVLGNVNLLLAGRPLLSFDQDASSHRSPTLNGKPDFVVRLNTSTAAVSGSAITRCNIDALPLILRIDLEVLDDIVTSFGGLSSILDLGSSVFADSWPSAATQSYPPPKGVRFEPGPSKSDPVDELKVDARFEGLALTIKGRSCSLSLHSLLLKAIHRNTGTAVSADHVVFQGPYANDPLAAPIVLDLDLLRLDFLPAPQDKDLERLLNIITPSKDGYDNDDDILIDTLLRQRKKGGLLRLTIGDVKLRVDHLDFVPMLTSFGHEVSKLAAVTEYLPEDDRPGILTLVRVNNLKARLPVNPEFGILEVIVQTIHVVHVGIPPLLAFSTTDLVARRLGGADIIRPLVPLSSPEGWPMLMGRVLGDEAGSSIKVKLFNTCFEYSVPLVMAFTGQGPEVDVEATIHDIAQSVADLAGLGESKALAKREDSGLSATSPTLTAVQLLIHESALGLSPVELPSKALFLLSDARLSTSLPPGPAIAVDFEVHRASILIIDEIAHIPSDLCASNQQTISLALSKAGFVSVGTIRSASVAVKAVQGAEGSPGTVKVDMKNELFLLETCADSTQTLMATLGALAPPTPPDKTPKYLMEPMTIEDMMASFTGDPFEKPDEAPEKLFDIDDEFGGDVDSIEDLGDLDLNADDLLMGSEMSSSIYLPISIANRDGAARDVSPDEDSTDIAESLLEDDPFEMPSSPTNVPLGDSALMRDLRRQCRAYAHVDLANAQATDVGIYECPEIGNDGNLIEEFRSANANVSTPPKEKYPLQVHLRDFHVIWNLYDGYDWQKIRDDISDAVTKVEVKAEERRARQRQPLAEPEDEESVIGDFLFNSIYIGIPTGRDAQELRRQINHDIDDQVTETESIPVSGMSRPTSRSMPGARPSQRPPKSLKLGRSKGHKIAFELKGVAVDITVHPPSSKDLVNTVDVRVASFEIFDHVPSSTWRKFLTYLHNDPSNREVSKPMIHLELSTVRTLESYAASELVLHVSVLPLRLHVDQDALDFITRFFEFKDDRMIRSGDPGEQPFVQRIEIETVDMCLDYKPKHIDYAGLRSGRTSEFMNFVTLEGANIRLKHAIVYGLRGFDELHPTLNGIWLPDIQRNQLPTILAGLASVRSFANIGSGVRDVVAIPIREYRRDGRIVRSIQKGAFQFGKTTAAEIARLGAKVALGTQTILTTAEGILAPDDAAIGSSRGVQDHFHPSRDGSEGAAERKATSAYANQPLGVLSGLRSARRHLEHDLLTARDALIAVQGEVWDSSSPGDAAAAIARHASTVILRPVIGATKAVGATLLGVGNQVDQEQFRRLEDKYKKY